MLKKRQNEVKRKIFLFDEVRKKNRSAIIAGWEDEAAIKNQENVRKDPRKKCHTAIQILWIDKRGLL